jgi:hypothetical protein
MEVARSFWLRYGSGYTPSNGSSPTSRSLYTFDQESESASGTQNPIDRRPLILWRKDPKFEVSINIGGLGRHVRSMLIALLPTFVLPSRHKKPRRMFPTSYLDGLRGVAAFLVVVHRKYKVPVFEKYPRDNRKQSD